MDLLLQNAINTLITHGKETKLTEIHEHNGHTFYSGKDLKELHPDVLPPKPPIPDTLKVGSLKAAVELVANSFEAVQSGSLLFQVASPTTVHLMARESDKWGRRQYFVTVERPAYEGFPFNKFLEHEAFVIGLQQHFVPVDSPAAGDFEYVSRVSASITAAAVTLSENDGMSQSVTLKKTINSGLKDFADLRRIVRLAPWRTFAEVPQPTSEFIFRAKDAGEGKIPGLGLFECDGGRWRSIAMNSIKEFLKDQIQGTTIDVPVIS